MTDKERESLAEAITETLGEYPADIIAWGATLMTEDDYSEEIKPLVMDAIADWDDRKVNG